MLTLHWICALFLSQNRNRYPHFSTWFMLLLLCMKRSQTCLYLKPEWTSWKERSISWKRIFQISNLTSQNSPERQEFHDRQSQNTGELPVFQSKPRQKKRSKFDPYYPEIREKFENTPTTIMAVFKYFQLKYPGDVFRSYESFKSYVKANKLTELRKELMKPHLRFETGPGEQIQVDWKEDLHFTLRSGEVITFNIYTAVYGYSRYVELIYSPTRTTLDFIRCTIEVMKRAGGRPGEFLTDNMAAVVNVSQGRKENILSLNSLRRTSNRLSVWPGPSHRKPREKLSRPTVLSNGSSPGRGNWIRRKNWSKR